MTVQSKGEQESFTTLLNRFKKKMKRCGIMEDYLESLVYRKPSEIKNSANSKKKRQARYKRNEEKNNGNRANTQ